MTETMRENVEAMYRRAKRDHEGAKADLVRECRQAIRELERAIENAESGMSVNREGVLQRTSWNVDVSARAYVDTAHRAKELEYVLSSDVIEADEVRDSRDDSCPTCDRVILDNDEDGFEREDGQRFCLEHVPCIVTSPLGSGFRSLATVIEAIVESDPTRTKKDAMDWLLRRQVLVVGNVHYAIAVPETVEGYNDEAVKA